MYCANSSLTINDIRQNSPFGSSFGLVEDANEPELKRPALCAVSAFQVDNRSLLSNWHLQLEYDVKGEEQDDAADKFLYVSTVIKNDQYKKDYREKELPDGEVLQAYFQMKDPWRASEQEYD